MGGGGGGGLSHSVYTAGVPLSHNFIEGVEAHCYTRSNRRTKL